MLLANSLKPLPGNRALIEPLQRHGQAVLGDHGVPAVIYGAGPRTVLESDTKRADEHLVIEDLRRATKVIARTLLDLLRG